MSMISGLLTRIFGSRNERLLKQYQRTVDRINALEPQIAALSDDALKAKTAEFRQRVANGESLDTLLPEAFAVVREAAKRTLGMRHFDVQLIGGMVLHDGKIAEMRTGEGKTLTATLAVYLNALAGKGVHVVTVNDYLATRDAEWMGKVYRFLGMTVGVIVSQQPNEEKRAAYAADITYGTNNEYGFDYLRDNMEYSVADRRQRGLHYAIVDEVDSILIDEARTPLIISGPAEDHTELYRRMNEVPKLLTRQLEEKGPGDFWVDEKQHQVHISESGHEKIEGILVRMGLLAEGESLYAPQNIILMHHLNAALRAHHLFNRDQHYVVQDGQIVIVDEFTGRLMPGRRWSEGLHQAIEAKEGVQIQQENQTLASITFQNYFRMYSKLAGMTGTADTEAYEFQEIYRLETVVIPTHKPMIRVDHQDKIYRTVREKYAAIIADIKDCYARGQPVLVGTTSIENSEVLSNLLKKEGLPHQVLNAKQHAREAEIVAQAGRPKMITIATNMAGRGTDIVLGGNVEKQVQFVEADPSLSPEEKRARIEKLRAEWQSLHDQVVAAGGLKIIGSERHESRRIDNQLRGRAGRQGDPGESRFYLSMEDPLLRIFAGDKMRAIMDRLKMPEGEAIEAGMVSRSIETAQRKVEARNFDIRKHLLEYDNVMNHQRQAFYTRRREALEREDVHSEILDMSEGAIVAQLEAQWPEKGEPDEETLATLAKALTAQFGVAFDPAGAPFVVDGRMETDRDAVGRAVFDRVTAALEQKKKECDALAEQYVAEGYPAFTDCERGILLQILDAQWKDHLHTMDGLREGVSLRGYASRDPKLEYQREGYALFEEMNQRIDTQAADVIFKFALPEPVRQTPTRTMPGGAREEGPEASGAKPGAPPPKKSGDSKTGKIGRNDPCTCGSGRKYKKCCGAL